MPGSDGPRVLRNRGIYDTRYISDIVIWADDEMAHDDRLRDAPTSDCWMYIPEIKERDSVQARNGHVRTCCGNTENQGLLKQTSTRTESMLLDPSGSLLF